MSRTEHVDEEHGGVATVPVVDGSAAPELGAAGGDAGTADQSYDGEHTNEAAFRQLVVNALVIPFTAGVAALLYLDQRMRREGLNIVLVRAAQDRAATRAR